MHDGMEGKKLGYTRGSSIQAASFDWQKKAAAWSTLHACVVESSVQAAPFNWQKKAAV